MINNLYKLGLYSYLRSGKANKRAIAEMKELREAEEEAEE